MTRFILIVTMLAFVGTLTGCATTTTTQPKTGTGGLLTDIESAAEIGYRIDWQTTLALPRGKTLEQVTPIGDYIVTRESGNIFAVISARDGRIVWRKTIGHTIERFHTPLIVDQTLMASSETRAYFHRLDNGALVNTFSYKRNAATDPIVSSGYIILGGPRGRMFAHDVQGGYADWEYQMGGPITNQPVLMSGLMLVTDESGSVAVLNPASGAIIWRTRPGSPPWDQVVAQPVASESVAYVASVDQKLYAFERTSGQILWEYLNEAPLTHDPVLIGDLLLQRTTNRGLLALDALTGEELWRSDVAGQVIQRRNDQLLLREGNVLNTIDVETGEFIATAQMPLARTIIAHNVDGGPLYLAHTDGRLMKLSPR